MTTTTSAFTVDTWQDQPYDEQEGVSLARVQVTKTFHGDLEGRSTAELITVGGQEGSRAYVALERVVGTLRGRSGTFVLHHTAIDSPRLRSAAWIVVPGTGTGELRGIHGTAQIAIDADGGHSLTLEYELD
jgi:hypothetical protein